jgi:hypothetical protein
MIKTGALRPVFVFPDFLIHEGHYSNRQND